MTLKQFGKYAAKFLTALLGAASIAVTQGLLSGTAAKWAAVAIAVGTSLGIFFVPNAPAPTVVPAPPGPGPDPAHPFPPVGG